jgi:hypothetical protein
MRHVYTADELQNFIDDGRPMMAEDMRAASLELKTMLLGDRYEVMTAEFRDALLLAEMVGRRGELLKRIEAMMILLRDCANRSAA